MAVYQPDVYQPTPYVGTPYQPTPYGQPSPPDPTQQLPTGADGPSNDAAWLKNQWSQQAELTAYQQQLQMLADARKNDASVSETEWERRQQDARTAYEQSMAQQTAAWGNQANVSQTDYMRAQAAAQQAYQQVLAGQTAQWAHDAQVGDTNFARTNELNATAFGQGQTAADAAAARSMAATKEQQGFATQTAQTSRDQTLADRATSLYDQSRFDTVTQEQGEQQDAYAKWRQSQADELAAKQRSIDLTRQQTADGQQQTAFSERQRILGDLESTLRTVGNDANGGVGAAPAPYVAPAPPSWGDQQGAIDAAFNKAKDKIALSNRASLNGLRNFTAATDRMGSGYESAVAGNIFGAGEQQLADNTRDNLVADATAHNAFDTQNYGTSVTNAKDEAQSRYDIWTSQAQQAAQKRQSLISLASTLGGY